MGLQNGVFSRSANCRGVAFLISSDIDISISNIETDNSGRHVLIDGILSDPRYVLVNFYAPSIERVND